MSLTLFSVYERTCLEIFAHSIKECHHYGAKKWGITVANPRHYRLVMGNLIVATIESGAVWLAIDIPTDQEKVKLDKMINWGWSPQWHYKNPPSKTGFYWPMEDKYSKHEKFWPIIQPLHDRYLPKVAEAYDHLRTTSQRSHSNQALAEIEKALGINLPRPNYSRR
jgi:hypothetical protein